VTVRKIAGKRGAGFRFAEAILIPSLTAMSRRRWIDGDKIPASGGVVSSPTTHQDRPAHHRALRAPPRPPAALPVQGRVVGRPFVGWVTRSTGQIPVARMSSDAQGAFDAAEKALRDGECVVVYPEGTITRDPDLWPMRGKTGAARMALATGVPVIPVGHWGEQELLPPYAKRPHLFPRKTSRSRSATRSTSPTCSAATHQPRRSRRRPTGSWPRSPLVEDLRGETAPAERFDPKARGGRDRQPEPKNGRRTGGTA
jgi:hypothetical protein